MNTGALGHEYHVMYFSKMGTSLEVLDRIILSGFNETSNCDFNIGRCARTCTGLLVFMLTSSFSMSGLCCLMTPDLSKGIRRHVLPYFSKLANHQINIRPHIKMAVSAVISYGDFNLPQGFAWVCMG